MGEVWIGCAGWTLPKVYRPHRPETFERWAASVPAGFRFSLEMHRAVTHFRRLKGTDDLLASFFEASAHLEQRRGPVVVQLPPTLRYEEASPPTTTPPSTPSRAGCVASAAPAMSGWSSTTPRRGRRRTTRGA